MLFAQSVQNWQIHLDGKEISSRRGRGRGLGEMGGDCWGPRGWLLRLLMAMSVQLCARVKNH